ncbi:MAG: hypothetical protein M3O46_19040 [Myxococcota bacterium]|nr:hypothetical protein [Myxococcota bacterium]
MTLGTGCDEDDCAGAGSGDSAVAVVGAGTAVDVDPEGSEGEGASVDDEALVSCDAVSVGASAGFLDPPQARSRTNDEATTTRMGPPWRGRAYAKKGINDNDQAF